MENEGCALVNGQCQVCCAVISAAVPCNHEVPVALNVLGLTLYPKCGCFMTQREIMSR
jgi:hypothetical protein